jgi:hypothetical protein
MSDRLNHRDALIAIHKLIVYAKSRAYEYGADELATLLNDIELLPTFLADKDDPSEEFLEMLAGIVEANPSCRYVLDSLDTDVTANHMLETTSRNP